MTYDEYIKNPMGVGASVISNRGLYYRLYSEKWDALLVRENNDIQYNLYKDNNDYYIHLKIPSEGLSNFYYDTIIRFYLKSEEKSKEMEMSLKNYSVQFYSNDPSFVFSFGYAFTQKGMVIPDLKSKMSPMTKEQAVVRNPLGQIGYVKSLYFAYLQMNRLNLFTKSRWINAAKYKKSVWSTVEKAEDKIRIRQEMAKTLSKQKKADVNINKQTKSKKKGKHIYDSPNTPNFGRMDSRIKPASYMSRKAK